MISSNHEADFFQTAAQKLYSPYNTQSLPVRCGQFLLFVIQSARLVENEAVASIFLLLNEYAPNLFIFSFGIERVPSFCSR